MAFFCHLHAVSRPQKNRTFENVEAKSAFKAELGLFVLSKNGSVVVDYVNHLYSKTATGLSCGRPVSLKALAPSIILSVHAILEARTFDLDSLKGKAFADCSTKLPGAHPVCPPLSANVSPTGKLAEASRINLECFER